MMGQDTALSPPHAVPLPFGGGLAARAPQVAVEVPVNLIYGSMPHVVLMATPAELEDLALGFSLTEGIIHAAGELRAMRVESEPRGICLHVDLAGEALSRLLARRRALVGRTGCGICGVEDLDQLHLARPVARPALPVQPRAIEQALAALAARQPLNAVTRAVHAAGWFDLDGTALLVREDVGRHNALDKMIGAALRAGIAPEQGFVLITSRCSYEMVEKTAVFGAATLVSISAPTSLAIERAGQLGLRLVGAARADGAVEYVATGEGRA